ncbi:unnamed protein product [Polarella glacialis]|uniref:EF-hand domain-containing protein n=1 Tax=Polarella glacialis TaxID=89957 RepID=A0A813EHB4_POLGL|nr:unnamed protein product [Polarella glacialis]
MGCGSSKEVQESPGGRPGVVAVGGGGGAGFYCASVDPDEVDEANPPQRQGPFLPFIRFDKSSVPKELQHGDKIFLNFTYANTMLAVVDGIVQMAEQDYGEERAIVILKKSGTGPIIDGDEVSLELAAAQGTFLECRDDVNAFNVVEGTDTPGTWFNIFKQGRPTDVKHRDTVYLQSYLCNYAEHGGDGKVRASRWRRGEPQTMTVLKLDVVRSTTTELARRMQFQAFDLDGNGTINRAEMACMLKQVKGIDNVAEEEIDGIMGACDPASTGNIPFDAFASWADNGGLPEELLQHAEVLGNIAQRCNDCLKEEDSLIEVLTTNTLGVCQDIIKAHQEKFGEDLSGSILKKSSEQDGWIFSNNWQTAMRALMESEVDLWTRCLNDAMRGLGTDEDSLTALVCTMPDRLRDQILARYQQRYGQTLLDHITSETSFSYKKVLEFQAKSPWDCRAQILNEAMVGLGTSEDQLIRVICLCDLGERRAVKEAYQKNYEKDLVEHVKSETSGDFQKALLCLLEAEEAPFDLDADCEAMKLAMDGWGTDETALVTLICSKSPKQMEDVNARFQELYGKSLLDRVKSETSGNFQETMMGCIRHPMQQLAESVRYCMKGWGTDDRGLITLLVHLPDFKKAALIKEYKKLFGRSLLDDIKSDTSGSYEKALCSLVRSAPVIWAGALQGAMKGLGTADELLINFLVLAKDDMHLVRAAFQKMYGKPLVAWIDGECSGDYKKTLVWLCQRNSKDNIDMLPLYWAQRTRDAVRDIDTLKDVLTSMPAVAIKRGTEIFKAVYGRDLRQEIEAKCNENSSFFSFSNYWKMTMTSLLDMPVERYVKGLNDAMRGWGTDESALTALVCTMPENMYDDINQLYRQRYGQTLLGHIESETSSDYKKALVYQAMSLPQSRAKALNSAMVGLGTTESQLIRIIVLSTMKERQFICQAYQEMYQLDLIQHIESETSGSFKNILVAVMESTSPQTDPDYADHCNQMKAAIDGTGTDEDAIIRLVAGKTPAQIQKLQDTFQEMFQESMFERVDNDLWDWGMSMFKGADFRATVLGLLRTPSQQLAYSVRDCIVGWGTDDTGLITCLVHLTERRKRELYETYKEIPKGGDLYDAIRGDTSGSFEGALLALVMPAPVVWAKCMTGAMKGLGTNDELLINWMCIAKDRMDEVRVAFRAAHGKELAAWIDGDCNGDYKDTLIRLANRECYKFAGAEAGLQMAAPPSQEESVLRFNRAFNKLCRTKKGQPQDVMVASEEEQQEMGCAFLYFTALSSCAPNLDRNGLWDLTNACGFPPGDDGPDLDLTFSEWDYSGTGEITWNDFVREMSTRINDPNHYDAAPLPEAL